MTRRIFFHFAPILLITFKAFVSADDTSCVADLPSFIDVFRSNETSTDNILKIRQTFYPQYKPAPHFVIVHYCYEGPCNNNDTANYTYIWTDNPIFFVVDYYLLSALTFKLAGLGDIGEQSFVVPVPCDNNTNKELLLALTTQLKSIGGTDKALYFAHHFDVNEQQDNYPVDDYDGAKLVIFFWLFTTTIICITAVHYLMLFEETRKSLGKFLKRFVQKYMPTNKGEYASIPESENDELILFFFIKRAIFPIIATAVVVVTIVDLYFFSIAAKYHKTSSDIGNFVILFPWPMIAIFFIIYNIVYTMITTVMLFIQGSFKSCSCENFLITLTLFLLFGIVYLVYHGFWIIVALLACPGRILIGGIFVVPFLMAIIPTWNMLIKVIENWCYCKGGEESHWKGGIWLALFVGGVTFWGLFIGTLIYISRFLLSSSANLENKTLQSLLSFVVVSAFSGILMWLNTDLTKYQKDNRQGNQSEMNQKGQND